MLIYLVGFMGSGKSTIGRQLAKKLNYTFIDLDKYIERQSMMSASEIFEYLGEKKFRQMEHKSLLVINNETNHIISVGGGTPCFHNNMEIMNKSGLTIYLKMSTETLLTRLIYSKNIRPLISQLSKAELYEYITNTLKIREPFYKQAKATIESSHIKVEDVIDLIKFAKHEPKRDFDNFE